MERVNVLTSKGMEDRGRNTVGFPVLAANFAATSLQQRQAC
ncbi:hypothetical protein LptCag_1536 [Leptospirillum ferriphilum]|uniref:Uncharacterized protein n=1 Tax=Leptospirillum ferriphilum TaxID=178606 RepID=A0A094YKR8_9BACT|nr:hypothetical protein LptCag_1536 [Leptospirillum ferriphilum]